ncbi:MAG: hypothetical protein ACPGU1_03465 [Myxococcota bacterium]
MKDLRLLSITRLSLLLSVTCLWACSGTGGTDNLTEDIGASFGDTAVPTTGDNPDGNPPGGEPGDVGDQDPGDVTTFGKDTDEAGGDSEQGPSADSDSTEQDDGEGDDPSDGEGTAPDDGETTELEDVEDTEPGDGESTETGDGGATELDDGEGADPGDSDETDPDDGEATGPNDVEEEEDTVEEEPNLPCDGDEGCEEQGATRCSSEGTALIQECKLSGGCLKWMDSEYCQFDEFFPNMCTGKPDICVDGACVPDGDAISDCPSSENACEVPSCDGATGECSIIMVEPGTPCDDGDVCTKDDICFGNSCIGSGADALGSPICPQDCLETDSALSCEDFASFELNGDAGTSLIDEYSCGGAVGYTGYETAFLIEAPNLAYEMPLTLAVELADPALKGEAFADIIVLNSSSGYQCWANECVAVGYMDDSGVATVELPAFVDDDSDPANDASYIVVVDGRDGFSGAVRLASWCVPGYTSIELYCTDGKDDDTDGMIDCEDPSCWDSLTCLFEHDCDNATDDDDDGAIDCADDDCAEHPDCFVEAVCDDGVDDEGDGLTDCEDDDCEFTPACSDVCEGAIPLGCGDILTGQDPKTGSNTFSNFPCSPAGINTDSVVYEMTHHTYHVQADEGCAARVRVSPESDDFVILDIYAMGPGCAADHCIEVEGDAQCQNPQTPASIFGGDACVQIPESFAGSSWVTVIPDNAFVGSEADLSYGLEVICDCQ